MIKVAVLMGSKSDQPVMEQCTELLETFAIPYDMQVLSAHRQPKALEAYLSNSSADIFICAAGMAAHLGGVVASLTHKPVIAVPMAGGIMDGLDALLSMVQMPYGLPVATLAVGKAGARNAAILSLQILALNDENYRKRLADFRHDISNPS